MKDQGWPRVAGWETVQQPALHSAAGTGPTHLPVLVAAAPHDAQVGHRVVVLDCRAAEGSRTMYSQSLGSTGGSLHRLARVAPAGHLAQANSKATSAVINTPACFQQQSLRTLQRSERAAQAVVSEILLQAVAERTQQHRLGCTHRAAGAGWRAAVSRPCTGRTMPLPCLASEAAGRALCGFQFPKTQWERRDACCCSHPAH